MRPLFTIHTGEFVVGEFIERTHRQLDIWVPAKDTGIDLLITGNPNRRPVLLQVKLSRDYKPAQARTEFEKMIVAAGWTTIKSDKLKNSKADLWVFVLVSYERTIQPQFVVIPPKELLKRLTAVHGKSKMYHFYPWVTTNGICLDGRGLTRAHKRQLVEGTIKLGARDLTSYLGNWSALDRLAK